MRVICFAATCETVHMGQDTATPEQPYEGWYRLAVKVGPIHLGEGALPDALPNLEIL